MDAYQIKIYSDICKLHAGGLAVESVSSMTAIIMTLAIFDESGITVLITMCFIFLDCVVMVSCH